MRGLRAPESWYRVDRPAAVIIIERIRLGILGEVVSSAELVSKTEVTAVALAKVAKQAPMGRNWETNDRREKGLKLKLVAAVYWWRDEEECWYDRIVTFDHRQIPRIVYPPSRGWGERREEQNERTVLRDDELWLEFLIERLYISWIDDFGRDEVVKVSSSAYRATQSRDGDEKQTGHGALEVTWMDGDLDIIILERFNQTSLFIHDCE